MLRNKTNNIIRSADTSASNNKDKNIKDNRMDPTAPTNKYRVNIEELKKCELDRKTETSQDKFFKEKVVEQLLDLIERGNILEDAARIVYLEPSIARRWYDS